MSQSHNPRHPRPAPAHPYRLLLLGPVHLEAVKRMALPILVQLFATMASTFRRKAASRGRCDRGTDGRLTGLGDLGLHLSIHMLPACTDASAVVMLAVC